MKINTVKALICGLTLGFSANLWAQDEAESSQDAARAERQARISELRQLLHEEQASRRQEIEARLSNLNEDERAALQERRRMVRQAQARRMGSKRGNRTRCDCDTATGQDSSE